MQILFAISVLSFAVIVWAAVAFARHIKADHVESRSIAPRQPAFKQHLLSIREPVVHSEGTPPRARQAPLNQSVRDITANKQWLLPPQSSRIQRLPLSRVESNGSSGTNRKPPQPARHGPINRIDRAYFSKDMGDLTDPYEPTKVRVNDRNRSDSSPRY